MKKYKHKYATFKGKPVISEAELMEDNYYKILNDKYENGYRIISKKIFESMYEEVK